MTAKFEKDTEAFLVGACARGRRRPGGQPRGTGFSLQAGQGRRDLRTIRVHADFSKLLGKVTDSVYSGVPQKDGEFTAAGIDSLLAEVKKT